MESLALFDDVVTRDLLFLSVHDAILFIKLEVASKNTSNPIIDKVGIDLYVSGYSERGTIIDEVIQNCSSKC